VPDVALIKALRVIWQRDNEDAAAGGAPMVRVYLGRFWSAPRSGAPVTAQKGTIQWVSSVGAWIIPETGEDVPETDIDVSGRYVALESTLH